MVQSRKARRPLAPVILSMLLLAGSSAAVEVVCHRGANEYAPENTRAAAQLAIDWGADYVEIDVRTSKDGVMYILHDPTLDRTTDGKGRIADMDSAEIDRLDAGSWFAPKFAAERVPRLAPYLEWIKGKAKVYFDVKEANLEELAKLIHRVGLENNCFLWFDRADRAVAFRKIDAKLPLKVNAWSNEDIRAAKEKFAAQIVEIRLSMLTPETTALCRELGLKAMVYHPEKDPAAFRKVIEGGADMINLDHADVFLKVAAEVKQAAAAK